MVTVAILSARRVSPAASLSPRYPANHRFPAVARLKPCIAGICWGNARYGPEIHLTPGAASGEVLMIRILSCLAAIFLVAASAHAQQASRLDEIVKRGTLRVGLTGDYLPFSSFDKQTSKFRGYDVDMAESLGKAL